MDRSAVIVSIHQPNFMPWLPFFRKIQMADVFVVMIHCQFEKNGYQNRFNIDQKWYTMSVKKGLEPIKDKVYLNPEGDWRKIKSSLQSYGDLLGQFDSLIGSSLSDTNVALIRQISELLGFKTKIILDYETSLASTERLVDICKTNGATRYLSGTSGQHYLDLSKFKEVGIEVDFQVIDDKDKKPIAEVLKNGLT